MVGIVVGQLALSDGGSSSGAPSRTRAVASIAAVPADAIGRLEAAVNTDPNDLRALQQLGVAYARRAATDNPSYYALAADALRRATRLAPNDDTTLIASGVLALSLHQFDRARALGERVVQHNPNLNDADAVLVDANVELGHYVEAERYLQLLVDRRPGLPAYSRVSYLRELHGDLDGAQLAMQQAINAGAVGATDTANVIALRGDIEFARGDYDVADRAYATALRDAPLSVVAQYGRARIAAARGQTVGAITQLQVLTRRYPLPSAIALLGDLQRRVGRTQAANDAFDLVDATTTLARNAGQVVDLEAAQFALDHSRIAQGVASAKAAYAARPLNVFANDAMAWASFRVGDVGEAQRYMAVALRLGSADAAMHWHAAAIAAALHDRATATKELRFALHTNQYFTFAVRAEVQSLARTLGVAFVP